MFDYSTIPAAPVRNVSACDRPRVITELLNQADRLYAEAIELVGRGGIEAVTGISPEMMLMLDARRTYADARSITHAAAVLQQMPCLAAAFRRGVLSWTHVRSIVYAVTPVPVSERAEIDEGIGARVPALSSADPDHLVDWVDDEVRRRRPELAVAREDRAIKASFLQIQGQLDGGSTFFGRADPESTATFVQALDARAEDPVDPDEGPSRAQQRFDALLSICEDSLSGASGGSARPRPRLLATIDLADREDGIEFLWSLPGRSPKLTPVARDVLSCDATIVPVLFDGHRPIAVGDARHEFSDKVRTAIIARDRRCRFCRQAPASWCDVHHIDGKGNSADDGLLLCRRCHRRVHRYNWNIQLRPDGVIEFSRLGKSFLSLPP